MTKKTVDLTVSFDTTGSMAPVIAQVRRNVEDMVHYLFENVPDIRIGIIAHGDYCDGDNVMTVLDLSSHENAICEFIRKVRPTSGGDSDECYELVLHRARSLSWTSGTNKAMLMIGDADPHRVGYRYNGMVNKLDWRNELGLLVESGVTFYAMQAMGHYSRTMFYRDMALIAGTPKLDLNQFSDINQLLMALAMSRCGKLEEFEQFVTKKGMASRSVLQTIDSLAGRKTRSLAKTEHSLHAVHPSRFQILDVDHDCSIKDFVESNGLRFAKGRGFYEFTKSVLVQDYKEIVIQHKATGEMFSGPKAREILGIPTGTAKVRPSYLEEYRGFIQSTSSNRKLIGGTKFLYEAEEC